MRLSALRLSCLGKPVNRAVEGEQCMDLGAGDVLSSARSVIRTQCAIEILVGKLCIVVGGIHLK